MDVQSCDAFSHAGTTSICTQNITADQNHVDFGSSIPEQTGFGLLLETPILMVSNLQLDSPSTPAVVLSGQRDGRLPGQTTPRMPSLMSFTANHGPTLLPTLAPPSPGETTRVAQMSGGRGTDRKHGQVGSPDRKQEVM